MMVTPIYLRKIKRVLIALTILAVVIILVDQMILRLNAQSKSSPGFTSAQQSIPALNQVAVDPLEVFQTAVEARNLFNVALKQEGSVLAKNSILELIKDYRLKGVAHFNNPEGIIEDARAGSTIFVKEGEKLGPITVKKIKKDSLILACDGEEAELQIQGGVST